MSNNKNNYIEKTGKYFRPKKSKSSYESPAFKKDLTTLTEEEFTLFGFSKFFNTVGNGQVAIEYTDAFKYIPQDMEVIKGRQEFMKQLLEDDDFYVMMTSVSSTLSNIATNYTDMISKKVNQFLQFDAATTTLITYDKTLPKHIKHLKAFFSEIHGSEEYKLTKKFVEKVNAQQIVPVVEREMDNNIEDEQFTIYDGEARRASEDIAKLRQRLDSLKFITDFFREAKDNDIHPDASDVIKSTQIIKYFEKRLNEFITPSVERSRSRQEYDPDDFYSESKRTFAAANSFIQERLNAFLPSEISWNLFDQYLAGMINIANFYRELKEENIPVKIPVNSTTSKFSFTGMINPLLYTKKEKDANLITPIDFSIDKEKPVAVITGPNSGGKTTLLEVVGHLQYSYQLGLPWPAKTSVASPMSKIAFYKAGSNRLPQSVTEEKLLEELGSIELDFKERFDAHERYRGDQVLDIGSKIINNIERQIINNSEETVSQDEDGFYLQSLSRFYQNILPQLSPGSILLIDEFGLGTNTNEVYKRSNYIYDIAKEAGIRILHSTHLVELAQASLDGKIEGAVAWGIETTKAGYSTYVPRINKVGGSNGDRIAAEAGLSDKNKKYIVQAIQEKGEKKTKLFGKMQREKNHSGIDAKKYS